MAKVSVIVPVYNVEEYLPECLESILSQTLGDIEVICVNDGSTDNSGKILDQYAARDERVHVLHRANAGYGAAMNAGLDVAMGEYIGIVESDDCIGAKMYQTLYSAATEDDLDLVKSDAYYWMESVGYLRKIHDQWLDEYYDRVLYDEDRNTFFDFYMNIWTGIYKREFLKKYEIRFHESPGAAYQDNGFWMQTLLYCQKAKWLSQAFYRYRQDNPLASVKSQGKMTEMADEYEFLARILCGRGEGHFLSYCYYYKLFRHRGTFLRIADEHKRKFCEQIKKDYAIYKGFIKGNAYMGKFLHDAAVAPDEVCSKVISKKQELRDKFGRAAGIVIYGAGNRGDRVFRALYHEGYYDKICCFAVSQEPVNERIAGKTVLKIQNACELYRDALVIVAVVRGSGMYHQMAERLKQLGISNYVDGSDIEDNFYIV